MLVLSRRLGEKIWIGDDICVTLVDVDRGKVRIGIDAPKRVQIYRQELLAADDSRLGPSQPVPRPPGDGDPPAAAGGS